MTRPRWKSISTRGTHSRKLGKVTDFQERLYWRLYQATDNYGTMSADPWDVLHETFPGVKGVTEDKLLAALLALQDAGLVVLFECAEGRRWLHIDGHDKHQAADFLRKRGKRHSPPPPDDGMRENPTNSAPRAEFSALLCPLDGDGDGDVLKEERDRSLIDVREVFDHWKNTFGKNGSTILDYNRKTRIQWALQNYGKDNTLLSITGYGKDEWVGRKRYCELKLLLRDADHIEKGIELATNSKPNPDERVDYGKYNRD